MFPVWSWYDASYGIYENFGRITSDSEYGHYVYDNTLEKLSSNTTSCEGHIFRVLGTYMIYPFWCCGIPTNMPWNTSVIDGAYLTTSCHHVNLPFAKQTDRTKHVVLILKV